MSCISLDNFLCIMINNYLSWDNRMVEIYIILSLILGIGIGYTLANQNKASNEEMENRFKALALDINETVSDSNTSKF